MDLTEIISVDPGQTTLGALNKDVTSGIIRNVGATVRECATPNKKTLGNFIFACKSPGIRHFGIYTLLLRLIFSALIILSGILILINPNYTVIFGMQSSYIAIVEITLGGMLLLGLLGRIVMSSAIILFASIATANSISGTIDTSSIFLTFGSLTFLLYGCGKYSLDFIIRKHLVRKSIKNKRRLIDKRMSYQSYQYM